LLDRLAGRGTSPMLWNPLPWARDAVVPLGERPTRVRANGLRLSPATALGGESGVKADGDSAIENGLLRVEVEADGSFFVVDKTTGERGGRQNRLISQGGRGGRNHSPPPAPARGTGG